MALEPMYPGKVNSPATFLAKNITTEDTKIEVIDPSVLPDAPNLLCLGTGKNTETILYNKIEGNIISDCKRGFQGKAKAWDKMTVVARIITEYDFGSLQRNLKNHAEDTKIHVGVRNITTEAIADGSITTSKIQSGCINSDKLQNDCITNTKLLNDCVTTLKIKDGSITTAKVVNKSITADKIYNVKYLGNHIVIGYEANVTNSDNKEVEDGFPCIAIGYKTNASGQWSTAISRGATASANYSIAIGCNPQATAENSIALGRNATSSGTYSTSIGYLANSSGNFSTAIGEEAISPGKSSIAIGYQPKASKDFAIAIGCIANVSGASSIALGYGANASNNASTALGRDTKASGICSTALGYGANASHDYSTAVGINSKTTVKSQLLLGNSDTTPYAYKALTLVSDKRDKTDIKDIDYNPIEFLNKLSPKQYRMDCRFNYKRDEEISKEEYEKLDEYTKKSHTTKYPMYELENGFRYINYHDYVDKNITKDSDRYKPILKTKGIFLSKETAEIELKKKFKKDIGEFEEKQVGEIILKEVFLESDGSMSGERYHNGFLAQEVEEVAKSMNFDFAGVKYLAHNNDGDDMYGLAYEEFIAPIIGGIQELSKENDNLNNKINELEAKLKELETKLN